jgi:hypothetical protein
MDYFEQEITCSDSDIVKQLRTSNISEEIIRETLCPTFTRSLVSTQRASFERKIVLLTAATVINVANRLTVAPRMISSRLPVCFFKAFASSVLLKNRKIAPRDEDCAISSVKLRISLTDMDACERRDQGCIRLSSHFQLIEIFDHRYTTFI